MFLSHRNGEHLNVILVMAIKILVLVSGSSLQDVRMARMRTGKGRKCRACKFRSGRMLSFHPIPKEFPLLKVEHTIYPRQKDVRLKESCPYIKKLLVGLTLKHMKCSVMNIRFVKMIDMCAADNVEAKEYFKGRSATQVIDDEFKWIVRVLLILLFREIQDDLQRTSHLDRVFKYLAVTLPDKFSCLRTYLDSVLIEFEINFPNESIKELFLKKMRTAEVDKWRHKLLKHNNMELKDLFKVTDAYFLYLIIEEVKFRDIYSIKDIMNYLVTNEFSENNALLEPFDACKSVFIAFIVSKFKQEQIQRLNNLFDKLVKLDKEMKHNFVKKNKSKTSITILLKRAIKIKEEFNRAKSEGFFMNLTFRVEFLNNVIDKMGEALKIKLKKKSNEMETWVKKVQVHSCYFFKTYCSKWAFDNMLVDSLSINNYTNIMKYLVFFGMNPFKINGGVCRIFDEYCRRESTIPISHCLRNDQYCWKCRSITFTILYAINFVMHKNLSLAINNYRSLSEHDLAKDFRVKMALTTAFFTRNVWYRTSE